MERIVDILIEVSLYSAVITAFMLLFRAVFKKRISPKVQYAMWLLLVLRLMLPVTIESGFHIENILPERPAPVVQQESVFEIESPVIDAAPVIIQPATDVQIDNTWTPEESSSAIPQKMPESAPSAVPEEIEPAHDINWRLVAFWVWAAGAMIFSIWMMIVKLRFYEDMQQGITSVSPKVYAIYDECCAALNVKPLTMWAVDRAISPGIAFFTYPVLLLPASMDGDEDKLRYAFLHELTHKKRYDHYMTALLNVLRILYWFNPAVHIGFAEMRADMETACDADVIAFVGKEQKRGYLTAILELFSYATRPQLGMSQASSRRMAKRRMKGTFMRERTTFLGRAAALMLAAIMLVGCFTTACQSAPVEVEEPPEFEAVDTQPESVIDVDGDGIADTITVDTDNTSDKNFDPENAKATLTVELGSGETITQEIPGWWQNAEYHTADFDSDNRTDIALMLWAGGSNYDATNVYVYHMGNSKLTELAKNVITNDAITYDQSRYSALNGENSLWVSGGTVIKDGEKTVLRLRQILDYDPGAGITTAYYTNLVWNGNGWLIESMEIGEAFGEEQVYPDTLQYAPAIPDPIDTLSDMDLLIYSSLVNNSKVYALPRTLSGNDLATEIWDRILITVNNQYFSSMPYDAAGAAYNVVAVTQDANSGIIDVYTILTYRRYTLLNDELSVDGELNCAVIWQYKETENGEIEFSHVYWPIKDSKGRVSYGNREWPEDLQKYTDFSPDSIGRAERLKAIDEQIAISMDNTTKVGSLLGTITSSPKGSSANIDYINEHVGEYAQLCAMGRRAVSRFMPRFEKGYETGLEGQIMAAILNALLGVDSLNDYENGQAWYDASRNGILAYMRLPDEKAALRDAILRLYPLADEIAAKGFTAVPGEGWLEESEALFQTVGLRLAGAGGVVMDYLGYTVEAPDKYCSNDLCHMYAAVLFAVVPNLYEIDIGNSDYITYNTYLDEEHEHLLATAVGDVISREDAEKHWAGLTKPLEEYGSSGSGIRELLHTIAKLSDAESVEAVSLQPTPALNAINPEWQNAERVCAPFSETGKRINLSYYEVSIDLNNTKRTRTMTENNVTPDQFDRMDEGRTLLMVEAAAADAISDDNRLDDLFTQISCASPFETVSNFVQLDHTAYFGADSPVYRLEKMTSVMDIAEPGWDDTAYTTYFVYLTPQWDYRGQTQSQKIVLGFRFVNAVRGDIGGWKLLQTETDCEKWMDTVKFGDAFADVPVLTPAPEPTPSSAARANAIVDRAEQLIGKKYEIGAYGPETFDSAGFVYYVLTSEGVKLTKQSCQKYSNNESWQKITDKADLQPGDILFYYSNDFTEINHAGIYIGDSKMIDASSSNGKVIERSCDTSYWNKHFAFARRVS